MCSSRASARFLGACGRWTYRFGQGLVGGALLLLGARTQRQQLEQVAALEGPGWWIGLALLPLAAVAYKLGAKRWGAFLGVRHFVGYPPIWVALAVGLTSALAVVAWSSPVASGVGADAASQEWLRRHLWLMLAGEAVLVGVGVATWLALRCAETMREPANAPRHAVRTYTEICAWVEDDSAIMSDGADAFDHVTIARRIASRLLHPRSQRPTMALIGPLGSGKTSILNLVRARLPRAARRTVRLVDVSLSPYDTTEAAAAGILQALVKGLHQEVSVPGLLGLPRQYVRLIEGTDSFWTHALSLVRGPTTPEATVQQLSSVAQAIGLDFVLWVEDLERFAEHSDEHLGPIRALLHLLDQAPTFSLVVATTRIFATLDLNKIIRFVEWLPEMDPELVSELLKVFRDGALAELGNGIDAAPPDAREVMNKLGAPSPDFAAWFGRNADEPAAALAAICLTPRILKSSLRRTLEVWRRLHGEIDFDDALVISMLREAEPEIFEALSKHVGELRGMGRFTRRGEKRKSAFSKDLEQLQPHRVSRDAIQKLVDFVFPEEGEPETSKPQGLCHPMPRDYWARYMAVPELTEAERDQPILQACFSTDDLRVGRVLIDPERSKAATHFILGLALRDPPLFPAARLASVLNTLIPVWASEDPRLWPERAPSGLTNLWALLRKRAQCDDRAPHQLRDALATAISTHLLANLQLVEELEHWFVFDEKTPSLLAAGDVNFEQELRSHLERQLTQVTEQQRTALAHALGRAHPRTLARIVNTRVGSEQGKPEQPP